MARTRDKPVTDVTKAETGQITATSPRLMRRLGIRVMRVRGVVGRAR